MNKRVLVTVHNGYLGSVMTPVLVDAGWDVGCGCQLWMLAVDPPPRL